MSIPSTNSPMARLIVLLIGLLWILGLIQVLFPTPQVSTVMVGLLACVAIIALPQATWNVQLLCAFLAIATIALANFYDQWAAIENGLTRAAIFPAFLATIVLLRATADQRPEISVARHLFTALDRERRDSGLVVGGFLVGSILQVGVFAIMAPILGRNASASERREVFVAAMRGMALVPLWSPFVVGMAVASQYLPQVPLWQIMSLGLGLSAFCIVFSIIFFDRKGGLRALWQSLMTLAPVAPPIAIAALLVVGTAIGTGFSTLQALVLAMPLPCLLAVALAPDGSIPKALKATGQRLTRIGPETAILTFATTLGGVFEAALPNMGLLDWLQGLKLSPTFIIFFVITFMNLMGLMAIHSIVSGTILLVLFTNIPTGLSDLVFMQALLTGWGLNTAISLSSLSIVTGATMFELPMTRLISWSNIIYVFVGGAFCALILSVINPVLMA
jgi:hypothetical protein